MQLYSPFMPRSGNRFVRAFALLLPVAILSFSMVQTVFARNTFVINDMQVDSKSAGLINIFDSANLDLFYDEMENHIAGMRAAA